MQRSEQQYKSLCITHLQNLSIPEDLGEGYTLPLGMKITNSKKVLKSLLSKNLRDSIGKLESEDIENAKAVLYSLEGIKKSSTLEKPVDILNHFTDKATFFSTAIWLIKDNAVKFDLAFLEIPHNLQFSSVSSNSRSAQPCNSKGEYHEATFTIDEFNRLHQIMQDYFIDFMFHGLDPDKPGELNRLQRAIYFLQAARANSDLDLKVSFYCTCFESLFSTDPTELTHKLAERIAFFTGNSSADQLKLYNQIKEAYKIRSAIVHGDRLSKKRIEILEVAVEWCDTILRDALNKILSKPNLRAEFIGSNEKLEQFLIEVIFGLRKP